MKASSELAWVKYFLPAILALGALDSALKEIREWIPSNYRQVSFYLLGPIVAVGMVLLIPYLRSRVRIVTPKRTSSFIVAVAIAVSSFQAVLWALMYYQVLAVGTAQVNTLGLVLKDVAIVTGIALFAIVAARLLGWYRRTRNVVVLLFCVMPFGFIFFAALHMLSDYLLKPLPSLMLDGIAAGFMLLMWPPYLALILMQRAFFGGVRVRYLAPLTLAPVFITTLIVGVRLAGHGVIPPLNTLQFNILVVGLFLSPLVYLWGFLLLVPALPNFTAKDYFRTVGHSVGLVGASSCGIGLGLPILFPLLGFPSLTMFLPSAAVSYAGFTSVASYFSISEDVRRQIREAAGFVASIGEAESMISTERQVGDFYDRFTGLAKASGAVEEAAISKDEIYKYADALKRIQRTSTVK